MAPGGSLLCCSPRQNLPPPDSLDDELARDPDWVGGPYLGSTSLAPSRKPTPGPELVSALIPALVPAPTPLSSDELFKQFIKAYLESSQGPGQPPAERKRFLKAKVSEENYGKSHMDCYHFCQQCKDHFETTGATGTNRIPFAAFFLCGSISICWTQYKHCHRGEELTPIT